MAKPGRPATAADVAAHAGVSRATVSHILNGRDARFPQTTRDKVRASAEALDYRPSPAGRSLVTGRGDTIVFLMPNTTMESNIQDAVERLAQVTAHVGSNVVLRLADADPDTTVTAILRLRPLGVVDLGFLPRAARERLARQGVPTVPRLSSHLGEEDPDGVIARLQVQELVREGPRRVVYAGIADNRSDPFGPRRFNLVTQICRDLALEPPEYLHIPLNVEGATAVLEPRWAEGPLGVACYNDSVAISVLTAAADRGLSVPEEVSAVGNDDTAIGQLWRPRLTTIRVDIRAIIDRAAEQLLGELDLPVSPLETTGSPQIELVRGDST
ncbi:LacI family DNA-binding transcriptional regulator [Humibacter antri]